VCVVVEFTHIYIFFYFNTMQCLVYHNCFSFVKILRPLISTNELDSNKLSKYPVLSNIQNDLFFKGYLQTFEA